MGKPSSNITIIDEGLTVEGDVSGTGEMIIRGTVRGSLSCERVTIAPGGLVDADIEAVHMTIAGSCRGKLRVSGEVTVLASGSCQGELRCADLTVEDGARLNARVCSGCPLPDQSFQLKTATSGK